MIAAIANMSLYDFGMAVCIGVVLGTSILVGIAIVYLLKGPR